MRPYASLSRKFLTRQSLDIAIVNLAKEAGTGNLVDIYLLRPRRDSRQLLLTGQLLLPRISAIRKKLLFPLGDFISRRTRFSCATMFERKATAAVTRFERQRLVLNLLIMSSRLPVLLSLQLPFWSWLLLAHSHPYLVGSSSQLVTSRFHHRDSRCPLSSVHAIPLTEEESLTRLPYNYQTFLANPIDPSLFLAIFPLPSIPFSTCHLRVIQANLFPGRCLVSCFNEHLLQQFVRFLEMCAENTYSWARSFFRPLSSWHDLLLDDSGNF